MASSLLGCREWRRVATTCLSFDYLIEGHVHLGITKSGQ